MTSLNCETLRTKAHRSACFKICLFFAFIALAGASFAQGLEGIIVEEYYVSDANDEANNMFGAPPAGSTTYRVYVDMAPGYKLQQITGFEPNPLAFTTSTSFFNSDVGGEFGEGILPFTFLFGNTPLDSYLSFGSGRSGKLAVLKTDDPDGSIIVDNLNTPPDGLPITTSDGLVDGTSTPPNTLNIDSEIGVFGTTGGSEFFTTNGSYFILSGIEGPDDENRVLIGQFTTDGDFEFEINVQIFSEDLITEYYTHTEVIDFDGTESVLFPGLIYPIPEVEGCTDESACNFNPLANIEDESCLIPEPNCTECNDNNDGLVLIDDDGDGVCNANEIPGCSSPTACNFDPTVNDENDDGSCLEPEENCTECDGELLVIIDDDGDGICNADEIPGCTSDTACNFNDEATDDNGSCIEPVENCTVCNETNDGLEIIDTDEDGVCDGEDICPELPDLVNGDPCTTNEGFEGTIAGCECVTDIIEGCISPTACNFEPSANLDDGSCIEPVENCFECNDNNNGLDIIDSDGDGICDANEIAGCTNPLSCNYNEEATDDDGSCTDEPEENCTECQEEELVLIDTDGDGICDANEVPGCTNPLSCNYNEEATDDDGSCTDEPEENCTECQGEELVIIDSDGDGICDANEIAGCTDPEAENYNPEATDDDGSCLYIASITLLELECGAQVIQVTNAQETSTDGGDAIPETRTAYIYEPDNQNGEPTYTGTNWPYLIAPVGFSIDDAEITADISTNDDGVLIVEGRPLYQFTGDNGPEDTNGTTGPWYYLIPNGGISQDACNDEGLTENTLNANVTLYPNPTRKAVNIRISSHDLIGKDITLVVFNALGEKVIQSKVRVNLNVETTSFNTEMLSQGVYLLNIEADNRKKSLRFIKN